jgi:hypothetical protein
MEIFDYTEKDISVDEFVEVIEAGRYLYKGELFAFVGRVEGKRVALKCIDKWLHQYIVEGGNFVGPMNPTRKDYDHYLRRPFKK